MCSPSEVTTSRSSSLARSGAATAELNERLDLGVQNLDLLGQALSFATLQRRSDHPDVRQNERLEYLGDSVVALVVATDLYARFPDLPEGDLTCLRAALVCAPTLGAWAREIGLDRFVTVADEELAEAGGRNIEKLLASVFEAVVAVVYLERGPEGVGELVRPLLDEWAPRLAQSGRGPKNVLQELTQAGGGPTPHYRVVGEAGPSHAREFTVEVDVGGTVLGTGTGYSKQRAEKAAAEAAIAALRERRPAKRPRVGRAKKRMPAKRAR